MKTTDTLILMIEGGKALDLVKTHIAARGECEKANREICRELGVDQYTADPLNGQLRGVVFKGKKHPDFKVPNRKGISYPKKGTEWEKRLNAQAGHPDQSWAIQQQLGVPCTIESQKGTSRGWSHIGNPLAECGFLFLGADGPYAMWIPNIPAEVAAKEAEGYTVTGAAKQFNPESLDGCRLIDQEEWDLLVAQYKLERKRKQNTAAA